MDTTFTSPTPSAHRPADRVFDVLPVPAVVCDLGGLVRSANADFAALVGVDVAPGTHWRALLDQDDSERLARAAAAAFSDGLRGSRHDHEVLVTMRRPDGCVALTELRLRVGSLDGSKVIVATAHPREEYRLPEAVASFEETAPAQAAVAGRIGTIRLGSDRSGVEIDERAAVLLGAEPGELLGTGWLHRLHPEDLEAVELALAEVRHEGVTRDLEVRRTAEDLAPLRVRILPSRSDGEEAVLLTVEEVDEFTPDLLDDLAAEVLTDPLTGLANRRMLWETLSGLRIDDDARPAACFVDLDDFHRVNDLHGRSAGDLALRTVADRLRAACRDGDLICRFGGDRFVVLLPHVATEEIALSVGRRIVASVGRPPAKDEPQVQLSASVGVVWTGTPGLQLSDDDGELLRAADVALAKAKRLGKSRAALFDEATRGENAERRVAIDLLRSVLDVGSVPRLAVRPVVGMDGLPLLLEVFAPLGVGAGADDPVWVAGLAVEAGLSSAWDRSVLAAALDAACTPGRPARLLMTLSPDTMRDPEFLAAVAALPSEVQLAAVVHESAMRSDRVLDAVRSFQEVGAAVVLRGAGGADTGFGSLRSLRFDVLELDARLVASARLDRTAEATVAALAAFAARTGARVVAPGVTDAHDLPSLAELGVDGVRGDDWDVLPAPVVG
jgi:diguanylate cyclase (GGDEF)-like protein